MNSIERVKAAIYFQKPDKVPTFDLVGGDLLPLPIIHSKNWRPGWNQNEEGLFPHVRGRYNWDKPDWAKNNPEHEGDNWRKIPHEEIDEWGCIWNMSGRDDNMGHPGRPSLLKWEDFEDYVLKYTPDPDDKTRFRVAHKLKESFGADKYRSVLFGSLGPHEVAAGMRGFSTYLIDHRKHVLPLKRLLEHLTENFVKVMKNSVKYGLEPHGFWLYEDLGSQKGPYFSPRMFEKFYEPVYRTLFEEAHSLGCEFHHHCCGKIDKLLPLLINWGLDSIELDSPRMSGYLDLKPYRGKIMFWGCVNIQSIYSLGTPIECEREVWHMVRNLGTKDGGFGAYFYPQPKDIQVPNRNARAFARGLKKYGDYSQIPPHWWDYPVVESWNDDEVPQLPPIEI